MMIRDDLFDRLFHYLGTIPVIDTHEHLLYDQDTAERQTDVLSEYTTHYLSSDLVSAGLPVEGLAMLRDSTQPIEKRWRLAEPFWDACRFTGYARALDLSARLIYGVDGIHRHTVQPLNAQYLQQRGHNHYRRVLKDLCHIEVSLLDLWNDDLTCEREFFRRVWQPSNFIEPGQSLANLEALFLDKFRQPLRTLDDWLAAFDLQLADARAQGMIALKIATAYSRSLYFPEVAWPDARQAMASCLAAARKNPDAVPVFPAAVQDYLMHHIFRRANEQELAVQIHTGLQEGNGNHLANSQPLLLTNLLLKYPAVRFDLFHIGYPFIGESCALAKNFANVTLDMCWSHIIAPSAARRALAEFIDAVPASKISAFGGDYLFVDGVCGHLCLARENVASVLADKIRQRVMDEDQARLLGHRLFYDNPKTIFRL